MNSFARLSLTVCLLALAGCGPQEEMPTEPEGTDESGQEVGAEWRIRKADTTVWLDPTLTTARRDNRDVYVLRGRSSRNLGPNILAFVPDDAFGMGAIVGPRSFEVVLDPSEMNSIAWGTRLLIRLAPSGVTDPLFIGVTFAPKLDVQAGTSKIFIHPEITPVLVGEYVRYRARASTTQGTTLTSVTNAEGTAPALVNLAARTWRLEWSGADVLSKAGHPTTDALTFTATGPVSRTARVKFGVTSLDATQLDPYDYWQPATCKAAVKACLLKLAPGVIDTEPCGTAMQVTRCQPEIRNALGPATFAADFKAYLPGWYAQHGAVVAAVGGMSLGQAQAAVSLSNVTELTTAGEDPSGHDLTKFRVFSHPDVAYPGSDLVWFGAYDRRTGALLEIYNFN